MMNNYWLYLEPYTFLFNNEKEVVFYNTINGSYLHYSLNSPIIKYIVEELDKLENGYGVRLTEKEVSAISQFLDNVKESFSGDIISIDKTSSLPFIFKPISRIMEERLKNKDILEVDVLESQGSEIMQSLNEVTLFLGKNDGPHNAFAIYPYHTQFIHSLLFDVAVSLEKGDYLQIIDCLKAVGIGKLNLVINSMNSRSLLCELYPYLNQSDFKICIYWDYEDIHFDMTNLFSSFPYYTHVVNIHSFNRVDLIQMEIDALNSFNVIWNVIVSTENDLLSIKKIEDYVNIVPYYNGDNEEFFKEYIYNDLESILEYPIDKQTIFRRQTINENFFGKLFILPNGEVHANMNCASLGNIKEMALSEIVYKEMTQSTAWFKLREDGRCKQCVNKYLCPSVSDYELAMQKNDLCHVESMA